ncbi:MAG TPA: hypothetical protein VJU15_07415 [Gemmatimonadales bacterium]|nr:hypothetical protein [Gemmatimonadales bacterium]
MRRLIPAILLWSTLASTSLPAQDPRVGLKAGWLDAGQAISNLALVGHANKSDGWVDPAAPGSFGFANSDLAFSGNYVIQGSFHGFQIWDVSKPATPRLRSALSCPGGQGDPSVYKNLLFISVEMPNGRVDCGSQGVTDSVSADRFRGVRIFDISDLDHPKQVATVQTCRGSHTHTLVTDAKDPANVYVYVSGTSSVRSPRELAGCSKLPPEQDPNTSLFRIEVIKVPLASPKDARIVNSPRVFADSAGNIAGLWKGGSHGAGTQSTAGTDMCHDITVYSAIGLAAGACAGNGILLDISDPANPKRVAEVSDPNFAYWHSATFNNDGTAVVFTDEWGGGTQPRCRATDRPEWGADAIFALENRKLHFQTYFKIAAAQSAMENCVAHNGSLVPVPGRDLFVQGWYQGGVSIIDFTDPAHPFEIAYFDRGPMSATELQLSGQWATYWYNGYLYGSEIGRGLDIFELVPSQYLSKNEIAAAKLIKVDQLNAQNQEKLVWPASFLVSRVYLEQLLRNDGLRKAWVDGVSRQLDAAEKMSGAERQKALAALADQLDRDSKSAGDQKRVSALTASVRALAKP